MNLPNLLLGLGSGVALGIFFFGGLWLTVQRASGPGSVRLLFAFSFVVRTALVLGGFYLLLQLGPATLLAALAGFILARVVVVWKLK